MPEFYKSSVKEVLNTFHVDETEGLNDNEVKQLREKHGSNQLESGKKINPFKLFLSQFNDVLIIVLIIAAIVSFGLGVAGEHGSNTEAYLILAIVVAIALVGFFNEYKAERTVEALRKLVGFNAKVRRAGQLISIPASELVPGDIIILEEGQKVPADTRLITVKNMKANESSLTGESVPAGKSTFAIDKSVPLGDQKNMVFSGTIITTGSAEGVVVATGQATEIGKIAEMVNKVEESETPMQRKLDDLGRKLGAIILGISVVVFVIIFFLDTDLKDETIIQRLILAFTAAVALAVAAIPEGLAFVVRISLALGARRMAAKNALVRKLSAVEALGSTDVICSDKTGTLTKGTMTVREVFFNGQALTVTGTGYESKGDFKRGDEIIDPKEVASLLRIGMLCNNAQIKKGAVLGDPTEGALIVAAQKAGLKSSVFEKGMPRVDEVPFSSDRKMMSTVHKTNRGYYIAVKGAANVVMDNCDRVYHQGKVQKLTPKFKKQILSENTRLAKGALRVLGLAYKETKTKPENDKSIEGNLVFAGLQGMMDPPRQEVQEVMHRVSTEAGMRVIMITGDHVETARAVASEVGIEGGAMTGLELDELTQKQFEERVEEIAIYARVNPEHKIRIVEALQKHGHQVAMTGDGVNDAPAIKAADIGIAMGITGTDAAKEASDIILMDDQFLTIINAIEEGRGIFDNVRKFVNYLLSANIAEVLIVLSGVLLWGRLVVSAAQLLFINIVTDGLPAIALGSDPAEKGIMRFKPHKFQSAIINKRVWLEMFIFGFLMTIISITHYWWIDSGGSNHIRAISVVFTSLVIFEMVRLIGIRSDYKIPWFSNPWLTVAIVASVALQVAVLYVTPLANIFGVVPIESIDWLLIVAGSLVLFVSMKFIDVAVDKVVEEG